MRKEACEKLDCVVYVVETSTFSDAVHTQLRVTEVLINPISLPFMCLDESLYLLEFSPQEQRLRTDQL